MAWWEAIPIIGQLFSKTTDLISEAIPDKDKANAIIGNLEELKRKIEETVYLKELETKTIPWVDALHKMGRQIMNYVAVGYCMVSILYQHQITQEELLLIGGPNIAYQLIKGKGK